MPSPQGMPLFLAGHSDLLAAYLTCLERKEVKPEHLPPDVFTEEHLIHSNVKPVRCRLPLVANVLSPKPVSTPSTITRRCTPISYNHEQQVAPGKKSNNVISSSSIPSRNKPKSVASSSAKKNSALTKPPSTTRKNNPSVSSSSANPEPVRSSNDKATAVVPSTQKKTASTSFTSPAKNRTGGKQSANLPLSVSSKRSGVTKKHGSSSAKRIARQVSKHLDGKDVANNNKKTSAAAEVTEVDVEKVAESTLSSIERVSAAVSSFQKSTSPIGIVPRRAQRSTTYSVEKEHEFHSRASRTNTAMQPYKSKTTNGQKSHSKTLPTKAASTHRGNNSGGPEVVEVRRQRKGDEIELIVLDNDKPCSAQARKVTRIREMLESNVGGNSAMNNAKATSSSIDKTAAKGNSHVASHSGSLNGGVSRSSHSIAKNRSNRSLLSKVRAEHLMIARTRAGAAETSQSIELSQPTPPRPNYGLSQDRNDNIVAHGIERTRQSSRLSQDRSHNSVDLTIDPTRQSSRLSQGRSEDSRGRGNSSKAGGGRAQTSSQTKTGGVSKKKSKPHLTQSGGQKQTSLPFARTGGSQTQRSVRGHNNNQNVIGNARRKNNMDHINNGWKKIISPKHAKTAGARKGKVQTMLNLSTNNKNGRSDIIVLDETPPRITSPGQQRGLPKSSKGNVSRRRERPNNGNKESTRGNNGRDGSHRGRSVKKNLAVVDLCSD